MHEQVPSERIERRSHPLARGILLGFIPYLVIIAALVIRYLASVCANDLLFILQVIAVALWGVELLAGVLCLFNTRWRSLALPLIATLLLSALLVIPAIQLGAWLTSFGPSPLCHFTN